jgi:hypothetical protein
MAAGSSPWISGLAAAVPAGAAVCATTAVRDAAAITAAAAMPLWRRMAEAGKEKELMIGVPPEV